MPNDVGATLSSSLGASPLVQPSPAADSARALAARLADAARRHADDARAAESAATAGGGGALFFSGGGGAGCRRALAELETALEELGAARAGCAPSWEPYDVLTQCLRCGWAGASGAAHACACLEDAALCTGSWLDPRPADVATRRLCLQAYRLHMLAAEGMLEQARQGLKAQWPAAGGGGSRSLHRLARERFDQRLESLAEWCESLRAAGDEAARMVGAGEGGARAFPAAWERRFHERDRPRGATRGLSALAGALSARRSAGKT